MSNIEALELTQDDRLGGQWSQGDLWVDCFWQSPEGVQYPCAIRLWHQADAVKFEYIFT